MTFRSISLPSSLTVDSWAASVAFMPSTRAMTAFASASTLRYVHQGSITKWPREAWDKNVLPRFANEWAGLCRWPAQELASQQRVSLGHTWGRVRSPFCLWQLDLHLEGLRHRRTVGIRRRFRIQTGLTAASADAMFAGHRNRLPRWQSQRRKGFVNERSPPSRSLGLRRSSEVRAAGTLPSNRRCRGRCRQACRWPAPCRPRRHRRVPCR